MDSRRVGKAISELRRRNGLTQKEIAEYLNVSDKAVSKWERGLSCPDIALLPKLANLLDTNVESILTGNDFIYDNSWVGVVCLGTQECKKINLSTLIYNKPLVYYLISYFFLLGINRVRIICDIEMIATALELFAEEEISADVEWFDIHGEKNIDKLFEFTKSRNVAMLGTTEILFGIDFTKNCQEAMANGNATILASVCENNKITNEHRLVYFDYLKKASVNKKDARTSDLYQIIPFLFIPCKSWQELQKDIEILGENTVDRLVQILISKRELQVCTIGRGMVRVNTNSYDQVSDASDFVRIIFTHMGIDIGNLKEISERRGSLLIKK